MRPHALALSVSLALATGCAQEEEAVLDYTVNDATPAVPIRALQVFELDAQASSNGAIALVWGGQVPMPDRASVSFTGDLPPPFRLCAVALGEEEGEVFHAVSEPVQLVFDETVAVVMTLAAVEDGGEVPEPCGPAVEPWPDGV